MAAARNGMPPTWVRDNGVDQVLGPQQAAELAQVHLGHQHPLVALQHVAEVGRERVQVDQVGLVDLETPGPDPLHAGGDGPVGGAPADDQDLGAVLVVDVGEAGCRAAMPATLAARSRVIRSWLAPS